MPDDWKRIDALFEAALEQPPEAREAFLRTACGGDRALVDAVMDLLHEADEAEHVVGESVADFAAPLLPGLHQHLSRADEPLQHAGPYRIERELGRGGMGAVYLAYRADGPLRDRPVALKLIKRGMDTDEILRRFHAEQRILAALEHPHIARLLDAGLAGDGRPYLAMEYVEGERIDRYCDRLRLSVDERLALFETVCEAVHYAHQKLVVHRDLKPSNILVTNDGTVKLLDFGIAKLLDSEADDWPTLETRTGMQVLTPEYASPEQLRGEPVTTASDVYALGVVLHELLTGRRPQDAVPNRPPTRPSQAVLHTDARTQATPAAAPTADTVSQARRTTRERLQRRLRGDLDVLLLTTLRHEPDRRYASAEALLDDLRRHRQGLPIKARPDTVGYRAGKFVRRHRAGVLAVAAFVLLAAGFVAFYAVRITQERNRVVAERDKAAATVAFLEDLFEGADPNETLGDTLDVFDLLARGARQIDQLDDRPALQASLQNTLGVLYLQLGDYHQADSLLGAALATRRRLFREAHPDVAQTLHNVARLAAERNDYPLADSLYREALALRRALGAPRPLVQTLNDYGYMLAYSGQYDRAEPVFHEALRLLNDQPDAQEEHATSEFGLATIHMNEARYAEAESLYWHVLDVRRALYGDVHSEVADVLNDLGNLYFDLHNYAAADSLLRQALAIRRRLLGDDHPEISLALHNLALVPYARGDYDTAEALMREALAITETLIGRENRDVALTLNNIGWVMLERGDPEQAEALFREALGIMQRTSGAVSADAGLLLGNVAWVLHQQGRLDEAEPFYRQALDVRRQVHGDENMHVAWRQFALAEVLREAGKLAEAEELYRASLALRRQLRDPQSYDVGRGLNGLGAVLIDLKRYDEAEAFHREALPLFEALTDTFNVMLTRGLLGASLSGQHRFPEADSLLRQSYAYFRSHDGAGSKLTQHARRRLATHYDAWGKPEEAAAYRRAP